MTEIRQNMRAALGEGRLTTGDGRKVTYEVTGHPEGQPVVLLHGTPGSRRGIKPRPLALNLRKLLMVASDRPGYGGSSRQEGRRVVDVAEDVRAMMDRLGYDRFGVVGRSGGGPHALACAAMLGERITRAVVLCSAGPPEEMPWRNMSESNQAAFGDASDDRVVRRITARFNRAKDDSENILRELEPEMHDSDKQVLSERGIRNLVTESFDEALMYGPYGWLDDVIAFRKDWGFQLEDITQTPVTFWAAEHDPFSPPEHIQAMAARVPEAELAFGFGASHFNAIDVLLPALSYAARGTITQ